MANLPTSIKNLNTLLGEQLTEGGGGGAEPLIVNDVDNAYDKTWQEIHDAFLQGTLVIISSNAGATLRTIYLIESDGSQFLVNEYQTDSADGYPHGEI